MPIEKNIIDRKAAEALHKTIGELLCEEVPRLPSVESRMMFFRLLKESAEKNLPSAPPVMPTKKPEKPEKRDRRTAVASNQTPSASAEEAYGMMDEIEELAGSICDNGAEFAESVLGRASDIIESVQRANSATSGQLGAMDNMITGLRAWFHD